MTLLQDARVRPLQRTDIAQARELLAAACAWDRADDVAEELLFGDGARYPAQPLAIDRAGTIVAVAVVSGPWVRALAVPPNARGVGIGSSLLSAAERTIARAGHSTVRVMDQPGNYLAPGVDRHNEDTIAWLGRRGYRRVGEACNLLVAVRGNSLVSEERAQTLAAACVDYRIRRAERAERGWLCDTVAEQFSPAWAFEVGRALVNDPVAVHIAVLEGDSSELAAFAAHDGNNRGLGWFGPAGTFANHRRRGLGRALLLACLLDVRRAGHEMCEIAWIGPREFYQRSVGTVGERRFCRMRKDLS